MVEVTGVAALKRRPVVSVVVAKPTNARCGMQWRKRGTTASHSLDGSVLHTECHIGLVFYTARKRWRCTDMGTRTIIAIALDAPDESWYNGPPYAVSEVVFDEYDFEGMSESPEDVCYEPPTA